MKFTDGKNAFELSIAGYQFPDLVTERYDSNWLVIQLTVSDSRGTWQVADPCMLSYEVGRLADWFDRIDSGNFKKRECGFVEPVVSFQVDEHSQQKLRIRFALESLPPWAQGQDEYFTEFTLSEINLKLASDDLRKQLEKYPQRAAR